MKRIAFFNPAGGIGTTSVVYHLAMMFAEHGMSVLTVDLDPQSTLSTLFLTEETRERNWYDQIELTVVDALKPRVVGTNHASVPQLVMIEPNLGLVVGDLALARLDDLFSQHWTDCLNQKPEGFRGTAAIGQMMDAAATAMNAELILVDLGPTLGAINRAATIATDAMIIPVGANLHSIKGLQNLGPTLSQWRRAWAAFRQHQPELAAELPVGKMNPLGYLMLLESNRASQRWIHRIPNVYGESILGLSECNDVTTANDAHCLAVLKHNRSLMSLAREAHKPMFHLKPADGAIGAHMAAAKDCYRDFKALAAKIAAAVDVAFT